MRQLVNPEGEPMGHRSLIWTVLLIRRSARKPQTSQADCQDDPHLEKENLDAASSSPDERAKADSDQEESR